MSLPVDASFNKLQQWGKNDNIALMINVDKPSKIQYAAALAKQQGLRTIISNGRTLATYTSTYVVRYVQRPTIHVLQIVKLK